MNGADSNPQPRVAADLALLEEGLMADITIGGCGFWNGLAIGPIPSSGIRLRTTLTSQYLP